MTSVNVPRLQLGLPRTFSLLFAGSALYIGLIDPEVRKTNPEEKGQLKHWSAMYNHSKWFMGSLALLTTLFGVNAYRLTKQPLWMYGSLASFLILPFTKFVIMGINNQLATDLAQSKPGVQVRKGIIQKLSSWVKRHRVRAILALIAAGFFYAAEGSNLTNEVISKA